MHLNNKQYAGWTDDMVHDRTMRCTFKPSLAEVGLVALHMLGSTEHTRVSVIA